MVGSQAALARPSDAGSVKVMTLECLEVMAWDKARGILIF